METQLVEVARGKRAVPWFDPRHPHKTLWCNGSTTGFGPVSLGSSPSMVALYSLLSSNMVRT